MRDTDRTAIVAGAGIGGLAVSVCLAQRGWDVTVLERAPALGEVGAGLQLSPNGVKVLRAMGLEDAVRAHAYQPDEISMRLGKSGRRVFKLAAGDAMQRRFGAPYLTIHRADLLVALADALAAVAPDALRLGAEVSGYRTKGAASITLGSGQSIEGALAIGADGLHSIVRRQMHGTDKPRYTGNTAWRVLVSAEVGADLDIPPGPCIWAGDRKHAVTYPVRSGAMLNFVGIVERSAPPEESWTSLGAWEDLSRDFDNWAPTIQRIIAKADKPGLWGLFDRPPITSPIDGHVALLGDAWHPMLPSMAQGACQAIEDAWVLATSLDAESSVREGLARYAHLRKPRVDRVQRLAAANLALFHKRTALGRMLTYGPAWAAGQFAPAILNRRTDWIYGHDVTAC